LLPTFVPKAGHANAGALSKDTENKNPFVRF
jgi:hypothetical protein